MARYDKIKPAVLKSKDHPIQKFSEDVRKALEQIHKVLDFTTNKDSFTVDGNIHCKSLYVEGDSIYIGGVKLAQPLPTQNTYYVTYNDDSQEFEYVGTEKTIVSKTTDYTAAFNNFILCDGTFKVTMPNITTSDIGRTVTICNIGTGTITGDGNGDDSFYDEKTIECIPGATLSLMAKSTTEWVLL